nr:MAG TPA: hypothetical protein [Bacteriophage sp.]
MVYCDFIGKTRMARSLLCPPGKECTVRKERTREDGR